MNHYDCSFRSRLRHISVTILMPFHWLGLSKVPHCLLQDRLTLIIVGHLLHMPLQCSSLFFRSLLNVVIDIVSIYNHIESPCYMPSILKMDCLFLHSIVCLLKSLGLCHSPLDLMSLVTSS